MLILFLYLLLFFFFNDTATTEIYTLSLHDALPIFCRRHVVKAVGYNRDNWRPAKDRKSTRLNSSHANISYAVFCLKKKKKIAVLQFIKKKKKKKNKIKRLNKYH